MSPLDRLVGLAVFIPIEIGARVIGAVPVIVDSAPAVADRVRREIALARFIGKLAVDHGVEELRERLGVDATAEQTGDTAPRLFPAAVDAEAPSRPPVVSLALSDYDHLSSAQVVAKLEDLDQYERDGIEAYELGGRHRRTILGKLDQLRSEL